MMTADQLAAFAFWLGRQPGILGRLLKDLDLDTLTRLAKDYLDPPPVAPLTPADVKDLFDALDREFSSVDEQSRTEDTLFRLCDLYGWDVVATLEINADYVREIRNRAVAARPGPEPT